MKNPQRVATVTLASLVILVSLGYIWWRLQPAKVNYNLAPSIATAKGMGEVLAVETARAIHNQGRIVLVTDFYRAQVDKAGADYCLEAFQRGLKQYGNISIVATEVVRPEPGEAPWISCPVTAFGDLLTRYSQTDAIIFLVNLPQWARVSELIPASLTAKIIAVDNAQSMQYSAKVRYSGYFANGFLSILISRKRIDPGQTGAPQTPREWFDRQYQVYTPQNYEELMNEPAPGPSGLQPPPNP
jgi:hypothetical protein